MSLRSLFNRKASRRNKSEQISKQNDPSAGGSPKEAHQGENSTAKNELSHVESVSQEALNNERKTCDVIESIQVQSETTISQDTELKQGSDQKLQSDNYNEITTDVEKSVRQEENEKQTEEKSDKNLSAENANFCGGGSSEDIVECTDGRDRCPEANGPEQQNGIPSVECVDEKDTCLDANGQKQQNSISSVECTDEKDRCLDDGQEQQNKISDVPRSQNDCTNIENDMKVDQQPDCVSRKGTESDERRGSIIAHEDATKDVIPRLFQEMELSEDNDAVRDGKLGILSPKNEGTNVDVCDQEGTLNTSSLTSELANKENVTFAKTNSSEEVKTSGTAVNVSESCESTMEFSSVSVDIHESRFEGVVTNCGDYSNSGLLTTTDPDNEHAKNDVRGSTESKTSEKIKSADIPSVEQPLENNKSSRGFSISNDDEHVTSDSQRMSGKKRSVATESEKMEVQNYPCCTKCDGAFQETSSGEKPILNNAKREHENIFPRTRADQDLGNESFANPALRTRERSSEMDETTEEKDPTDTLPNHKKGHDTEKVQDNETVSEPPPGATSISPEIPSDASTNEKSETQTVEGLSLQPNCSDREEIEIKQETERDSNSSLEIPENNSSLTTDQRTGISLSQDSLEIPSLESTSPLEDSLDSFPSGCEDFLGGQRTLMAAEQHPPPSWKVGYLQVKLPAKSRGRGKLKVWRQRWVVIQMDEFVKDSKNPSLMINIYSSECSNARRHSALFWCTVSASKTVVYRSQSKTHKYAFSISVDNDVVLHFAADSETASQEWMTAIRNLLWPPSPVLQLEKVLHGSDFEISIIDNEFSFHAGLLGSYGNMKITSNKLILSHPQTDHVIQEWYLNTLDKFQLLPQNKEEDAFKVVVMHTGHDSSTGSGQIILFCPDAVAMLQSIASTIHKLLQYRTTSGKDHYQKELANLAEWLSPALSPSLNEDSPPEDYYKLPRHPIRSILDIPNFSFEKPISNEGLPQSQEAMTTKPSMLPSATSASTFSEDSGISMAIQPDDFLNCSVTSFTIGGRPVRDHTSSESSDGYSPPCTPEMPRKEQQTEAA